MDNVKSKCLWNIFKDAFWWVNEVSICHCKCHCEKSTTFNLSPAASIGIFKMDTQTDYRQRHCSQLNKCCSIALNDALKLVGHRLVGFEESSKTSRILYFYILVSILFRTSSKPEKRNFNKKVDFFWLAASA